jgi:hypothetical protein
VVENPDQSLAEAEAGAHAAEAESTETDESQTEVAAAVNEDEAESAEQFGTIDDAGSPHNQTESADPETTPEKGSGE